MEIASPLPIPHRGGTKRPFVCSPFIDDMDVTSFNPNQVESSLEGFGSCGLSNSNVDSYYGNSLKRRKRFSNENIEEETSNSLSTAPPFCSSASCFSSPHKFQLQPNGPSTKRARFDNSNAAWNQTHAKQKIAIELQRVVDQQAAEIERLKTEKTHAEQSFSKMKSDHERVTNENRILKRAVTIQQERQNVAQNELMSATRYKSQAEERIRRLEQMLLTLQYHLQAQQQPVADDFMGFNQRPPDVF